ncbi:hypothetical protein ATANTOWER_003163 [Ataeniobius toweri]|uniref:Uncharacterized protein n=1 Tax=Ataeniobius toweri TaxID=208326 RepID=A0ABU7C3R5_9TELE|nr:hypothetical protein [Ataeniobius toweri]
MGKRNLLSHVRTGPYGDSRLVLGVGGWGSTRACRPPKSSHILQDIFKYDRQNLQVQFLQNHPEVLNLSPGIIWVALPVLLYCADIEALQVHLTKHPVDHYRKLQRSSPATTDSVSVNKNSQRPDLKETTEPTPSTHLPSICLAQQQTITSSQQHTLMSSRRMEVCDPDLFPALSALPPRP